MTTTTQTLPATGTWTLDASHSEVGFSVRHLGISKTRGRFGAFSGTLQIDADNREKADEDEDRVGRDVVAQRRYRDSEDDEGGGQCHDAPQARYRTRAGDQRAWVVVLLSRHAGHPRWPLESRVLKL